MLEAMACGCWVICNKIGTSETLLNARVASFYDGSAEQLATALSEVLPAAVNRQAQMDFVARRYATDVLARQLEQTYREAIRKHTLSR